MPGELLAERGVTVDHVSVYRWVQRFTPEFIEAARPGRHAPGDRWFAGETYLKVAGRWTYLYRAPRGIRRPRARHLNPQRSIRITLRRCAGIAQRNSAPPCSAPHVA